MEILFWKHKCSNPAYAKIYLRVTVDGQRVELGSTNIEILVDHWDTATKTVKSQDPHHSFKNEQLLAKRTELLAIYNEFLRKKKPFTAQQIKQAYENQDDLTIMQVFDRYMIDIKRDPNLSEGTIKTYRNHREKFLEFLISKKQHMMYLESFELADFIEYRRYLANVAKFEEATIRKYSQSIKRLLNWAVLHKMLPTNPLHYYRIPMDKQKPHVYLTDEQFEKLKAHKFKNKSAQEVADVFIVYCRTGFHYQDLRNIQTDYKKAIVEGLDGKDWIFWERVKTNVKAKVPFFKEVNDIIEKYGGWENLPIKSNQKMNTWLKIIAAELDFHEDLSVKAGRKTLTDWLLNVKGWSKEAVKVLLGLKSDRSLEAYGKADERRVILEMER
ncbi:phage integrase SAM-like domain-containing protein [Flectobacillus rivi]|uniref:Phage integrase SAM-like domain-containing protein n=1 Tax=Flectobacillus rivi TaxID=2984209 RepID=A0ABT6YXQ9_9BACT|nr:phage integrase SAM-like domain-containing protein [Flectobacillus rivi]MDI9873189.1 phage integrase SAM-like domain-containing protein [Flectobacillus rivi]